MCVYIYIYIYCEWPHKGSFAPTTNLKRHSCAFPQALKLHDDSQKVLEGCNSLRFPWGGLASNASSLSFGSSYGWSNKFPPSAPQLWALSHVAMKTHQSLYRTLQGRTEEAGFTKGSSCNNRAIHTRKNLCFLTKSTIRCWWPLGNWNVAISGDFGRSPVAWESPAHHSVGTGLAVKFHGENWYPLSLLSCQRVVHRWRPNAVEPLLPAFPWFSLHST